MNQEYTLSALGGILKGKKSATPHATPLASAEAQDLNLLNLHSLCKILEANVLGFFPHRDLQIKIVL